MEQLLELYKHLLSTANVTADAAGLMSTTYGGKTAPVTLNNKRLALPTREALAGSKEKITIFHPLYENIMLNTESQVLSKFRKLINTRLDFTAGLMFATFMDLSLSPGNHSKLNPEQAEILSILKNATEKTYEVLKKLLAEGDGIVNIYCKRSGKVKDDPFRQAAIVTFPLYKELSEKRDKYYGITVSNKDREVLLKLYRYIFPNVEEPNYYSRGSNSKIAPCTDCLMKAVLALGTEINDKGIMFESLFDKPTDVIINAEWVPAFEDLDKLSNLIRMVPMQGSNITEEAQTPATVQPATVVNSAATVASQKEFVSDCAFKPRGNLYAIDSMPAPLAAAAAQVVQPVVPTLPAMNNNNEPVVSLSSLYGNSPQPLNAGFVNQGNFNTGYQRASLNNQAPVGYVGGGYPVNNGGTVPGYMGTGGSLV